MGMSASVLNLERGGSVEEDRERVQWRPRASIRPRADGRGTTHWLGLHRVERHRHPCACVAPKRWDSTLAMSLMDGQESSGGGGYGR
jgi:hypothetical protein